MSKSPKYEFPNEKPVTIKQNGRTVTGRYRMHSGAITVRTEYGSKTALIASSTDNASQKLARSILHDLLKEGQA